jgi:hypothetical protein
MNCGRLLLVSLLLSSFIARATDPEVLDAAKKSLFQDAPASIFMSLVPQLREAGVPGNETGERSVEIVRFYVSCLVEGFAMDDSPPAQLYLKSHANGLSEEEIRVELRSTYTDEAVDAFFDYGTTCMRHCEAEVARKYNVEFK